MVDLYLIIGCATAIYDMYVLYNNDVPAITVMLIGFLDGLIWPIRWGHDIIVWLSRKRKQRQL